MSRSFVDEVRRVIVPASLALVIGCSQSSAPTSPEDWPMYGHDPHHSFATTSSPINATNVAELKQAWSFPTGDAVSASPSVVNGVVYVGSWDGFFYALDAGTGAVHWKFALDCQNIVLPVPPQCLPDGQAPPARTTTDGGLITSSATVAGGKVYFGGGKTLYCLNAADGSLAWKTVLCGNADDPNCKTDANDPTQIFSSPALFDGKVIFGHTVNGVAGYRGRIVALDQQTGSLVWAFEVDPVVDSNGNPVLDAQGHAMGQNRGCGSVWSTGALDEPHHQIFFGTGDCQTDASPPYHEAVLALDTGTGNVNWVFRPRMTDTCDFDFGASPNILDLDAKRSVGVGGKDGTYYVLGSQSGQLVWSKNVVFGGSSGGFIGSAAFDGQRIYSATGLGELGGPPCNPNDPRDQMVEDPSYHAFDARSGNVLWEASKANSFGASTVVNGVVFNGVGAPLPPELRAYDAASGKILLTIPTKGSVNSSATVVGKMIYFGAGNSFNGVGGAVLAYSL